MIEHHGLKLTSLLAALLLSACVGAPDQQAEPSDAEKIQSSGVRLFEEGDHIKALDRFRHALHAHRVLDDTDGIVTSSINIARTYHAMGDNTQARAWVNKAASMMTPDASVKVEQNLQLLSARIHHAQAEHAAASDIVDGLLGSKQAAISLHAYKLRAEIALATASKPAQAVTDYERALTASSAADDVHRASASRYRARLTEDIAARDKLYSQALDHARASARQGVIAAILQEWATSVQQGAEDRLLRALYIRASNHDANNAHEVLQQLRPHWSKTDSIDYWQQKLLETGFNDWGNLVRDFETFPE